MDRRSARRPIALPPPRLRPWEPGGVALAETERNLRGSAYAVVLANNSIVNAMREARK